MTIACASTPTCPKAFPRSEPNKGAALARNDSGSALVEFAVTLTVLCTMLFCFMQICLVFYSYDLISELAREGARYAMVRGASCPTTANPTCEVNASQVQSYVSAISLPNLARGTITPTASYPDGSEAAGNRVTVLVTYSFDITMPFVPKHSFTMSASSTATILQ